jgi:hypothetical protein
MQGLETVEGTWTELFKEISNEKWAEKRTTAIKYVVPEFILDSNPKDITIAPKIGHTMDRGALLVPLRTNNPCRNGVIMTEDQ